MWDLVTVLLLVLCKETSAACGPVEEGQTTTLTCTVNAVDCPSVVLVWKAASVFSPYVTLCTQNSCGGGNIDNLPTTISGTSSTLTINSVSRTSPFNMETKWSCQGICNGQTNTVCNKLVVYAKPENPSCTIREDIQSGDIKSVTVTCSTTKVYPKAKCSFERITNGGSPVTISQTPTYNHPPTAGTSAVYYMSGCSVTVLVSNLGEGTHSFQGYIYPDVTGGRNLVDVTTAPGTVTLDAPIVIFTLDPVSPVFSKGATPTFTCSANGNPPPSVSLVRQRTQEQLANGQENLNTAELTHTTEPLGCLDTGVYVCTGQNEERTRQEEISIGVNCPQQLNSDFTVYPAVNGRLNGMANLKLEIYGYPEPEAMALVRTADNRNLAGLTRHAVSYSPSDPPFGSVDVTISDLVKEDFTNYTITVDNGVEKALVFGFYLRQLSEDVGMGTLNDLQEKGGSDGDGDLVATIIGVTVATVVIIAALVVVIIILVRRINSNKETRSANSEQKMEPTDTKTDDGNDYVEPVPATSPSNRLSFIDSHHYEEIPGRMSTFEDNSSLAGQNTDPPTSYNTQQPVSATPSAKSTTTANSTYRNMAPLSTTTNGSKATYNNTMTSASAIPLANVTDQTKNDNYINVDQPRTTDNENGQPNDGKPYGNVNDYASSVTDA